MFYCICMQNKQEYLWAMIGRFAPQIIYLLTTIILARFLTPNDFGIIGVLSVFFMVANVLMDAGLGGSLIKERSISDVDCSTIFVFNILISHLLYVVIFFCSDLLEQYFKIEGLSSVVKILCLVFVINSWGLVPLAILTRKLQFKSISVCVIISVLLASFGAIILAIYNCGVYALVVYQIIQAFVSVVLYYIYSKYCISFKFSFKSFKRLIPFGFFTTCSVVIDTVYENIMTFLFGRFLDIKQAGFLYQAKRIEEVPSKTLITTINNVAFPVLTKIANDTIRFKNEANTIFKTIILLLAPLLATIAIFSKLIIKLILGAQWGDAAPYLSLLMFASIFLIMETLNRNFIKSLGAVELLFKITLIKRCIGLLIIFLCLIKSIEWVLYGYIISSAIGYIVNLFAYSSLVNEKTFIQVRLTVLLLLPALIYYCIMKYSCCLTNILLFQIFCSLILLLVYYLFIYYAFIWIESKT